MNCNFTFFLDQPFDFAQGESNKKIFMVYYCHFCIHDPSMKGERMK
jgi:hypothetical protein